MIGRIGGRRLPAAIKLQIIEAVAAARRAGMPVGRACEVLMLDPRRLRRWCGGRDPATLAEADVADAPPVARRRPHTITSWERGEILSAATEDRLGGLRHRKLTHHLSRSGRVFCSVSTTLRVLRAEGLVPVYERRRRPPRPRPEVDESAPTGRGATTSPRSPRRPGLTTWPR